jgi:pentatricopeptide repeat protein
MSSSHIYQTCHRRLVQLRPRRRLQWHQRAGFISLSKTGHRTTTDKKGKEDLLNLGDDGGKRRGRYASLPERKRQSRPQHGKPSPGDVLESLFEQSLAEDVAKDAAPQSISSLEPYKMVESLKDMIKKPSPPADSFRFFVEHFGPATQQSGSMIPAPPPYLRDSARRLIRAIITAKTKDPFSTSLPSVTEMSSIYLRLGLLQAVDWADLMAPLIQNLIKMTENTGSDVTHEQRLFLDLLGVWNVICRNLGKFDDMPEDSGSQLNWSHIPPLSSNDALKMFQKSGPVVLFGFLAPPFPIKSLGRLPPLALSTFQLLNSKSATVQSLPENTSRFTSALGRIIKVPGLDISNENLVGQDSIIAPFIRKNLPATKTMASQATNTEFEEHTSRVFQNPQTGLNRGISFVNNRLHEAFRSKNRRQVEELWADVVQWPVALNTDESISSQRGTLSAELCNYFILVYMGLRQPNRAIDVWNHMIQNRMVPSLATWDSMMSGCRAAKDPVALEGVWRKMQTARVQPDIVCWTTRISGLMACHRLDDALRALDEMGRKWLEAAQKEYPHIPSNKLPMVDGVKGAVKPTIETVNAAIVGAFRHQRKEYAQQILAWAGNYGITPDVHTYNILLRPLLKAGQTQQAMSLLQQMQKAGIEADIATYTTILDETFRFASDLSPEEQKEMVFGVFDEMESAGLKANLYTYGKILNALLQSESEDMSVVNIVLERMAQFGLEPSAHIYTDLVQHYLSRDPPQLDAARSTIERASMVIGSVDVIFWDRVVEGYSRVGETAAALRIVRKVRDTGSSVSWLALKELLNALARNEEWDMARALVRDQIVDTGGPLSPEVKGKEGQHLFWRVAGELYLLDGQGTAALF